MERVGLVFERTWVGEWNEPLPGWEQARSYGLTREQWRERQEASVTMLRYRVVDTVSDLTSFVNLGNAKATIRES